jgi:hypothetical protein
LRESAFFAGLNFNLNKSLEVLARQRDFHAGIYVCGACRQGLPSECDINTIVIIIINCWYSFLFHGAKRGISSGSARVCVVILCVCVPLTAAYIRDAVQSALAAADARPIGRRCVFRSWLFAFRDEMVRAPWHFSDCSFYRTRSVCATFFAARESRGQSDPVCASREQLSA